MFGPMKEVLRGRRFLSDEEIIGAVLMVKEAIKKNFLNAETSALKSRGITLKSNISFVHVYLK
jgi:hypothetical protein